MKTLLPATLVLVAVAAAVGCSAQPDPTPPDQGEDKIGLVKGPVDHAAIVEATTFMLVTAPTIAPPLDSALDPFNESDPFHINGAQFKDAFKNNLAKFDAYDAKSDWTDAQVEAWTTRIAGSNFLVVDTSKPCDFDAPRTYLEIERAQLTGKPHATCGGRTPNEDALDVTLNFMMRGPAASVDDDDAVHDGVDQATKKASRAFPYLAEMNGL